MMEGATVEVAPMEVASAELVLIDAASKEIEEEGIDGHQ